MKVKSIILFSIFFLALFEYAFAGFFGPKDKQAPIIKLQTGNTSQVVSIKNAVIQGQVEDENNIESLTLNQIPLMNFKGKKIFFSHIVELDMGENIVTIQAVDKAGNTARKTIKIIRNPSSRIQLSERLSLAVLPFKNEDALPGFQDKLTNALTQQNRFRMIERSMIDAILGELLINETKLFDNKTVSRIGRLVSARSVLTGTIINVNNRIIVTARIIDVETSKIISRQEIWGRVDHLSGTGNITNGLAIRFHQDFPLNDGQIIEKQGLKIIVDMGQSRLKTGRRLIVFRGRPVVHPVSKKTIGTDIHIIGHARIIEIFQSTAAAQLEGCNVADVRLMDRVITE